MNVILSHVSYPYFSKVFNISKIPFVTFIEIFTKLFSNFKNLSFESRYIYFSSTIYDYVISIYDYVILTDKKIWHPILIIDV